MSLFTANFLHGDVRDGFIDHSYLGEQNRYWRDAQQLHDKPRDDGTVLTEDRFTVPAVCTVGG